ncbi:hypothetical protein ACIP9H_40175 [Streptomyces sp. NPDC088732]|uniref:hypothetical protein n=1 Tax=Streptomyces sp. NPDC088732 TaxID=3365879 RepID=UPI0037F26E54
MVWERGLGATGGFMEALRQRVCEARAALEAAVRMDDPYAVAVAQDDLDDALRIARDHGIDVGRDLGPEQSRDSPAGS